MSDLKPTNPKDAIGTTKLPLHLWPETATALGCLGLLDGALKYGRANWRHAGVRASVYVDACRRHMAAWFEGEDDDPDSGLPHLAHALACLAIVVDAEAAGMLVDDRQTPGGLRGQLNALTPHVARLQAKHADKAPRHFTIADGLSFTASMTLTPIDASRLTGLFDQRNDGSAPPHAGSGAHAPGHHGAHQGDPA